MQVPLPCDSVTVNIVVLVVFKYLGFIVENLNHLIDGLGFKPWPVPNLPLPLGISFFIFQAVTYVVDIYRRHSAPARGFSDVMLYISSFPQLVAGPIVRYEENAERIRSRGNDWQRMLSGAELFAVGLAKRCSSPIVCRHRSTVSSPCRPPRSVSV
jgi:alginate O-acetyltransferase complex protein AlgI